MTEIKSHKKLMIYIDGIDDEYCYYLSNPRMHLFEKMQKQVKSKIAVLSTKSGCTWIDATSIQEVLYSTRTPLVKESTSGSKPARRSLNLNLTLPSSRFSRKWIKSRSESNKVAKSTLKGWSELFKTSGWWNILPMGKLNRMKNYHSG